MKVYSAMDPLTGEISYTDRKRYLWLLSVLFPLIPLVGMGLMLWLIMQPVFGNRVAWWTLFAMAAATIIGFEFSERLLPLAGDTVISAIQGIIVGTIIHSLIHRGHVHGRH